MGCFVPHPAPRRSGTLGLRSRARRTFRVTSRLFLGKRHEEASIAAAEFHMDLLSDCRKARSRTASECRRVHAEQTSVNEVRRVLLGDTPGFSSRLVFRIRMTVVYITLGHRGIPRPSCLNYARGAVEFLRGFEMQLSLGNKPRKEQEMTKSLGLPTSIVLSLLLMGCTSMRVTGDVVDASTGDVVNTCGVTIGPKYINVDSAGHFAVNARKWWKKMDLVCAGYEPQTVMVDSSKTRYPKYKIQVVPRKTAKARTDANIAVGPAASAMPAQPTVQQARE
jgi:hypothetical protein